MRIPTCSHTLGFIRLANFHQFIKYKGASINKVVILIYLITNELYSVSLFSVLLSNHEAKLPVLYVKNTLAHWLF